MCLLHVVVQVEARLVDQLPVAFTIDGKKYEVSVDASPSQSHLSMVASSFCIEHAGEVGSEGGQTDDCVAALVPIFEQVIQRQQHIQSKDVHLNDRPGNDEESGLLLEETITAEINVGGAVFSIPFSPSETSIANEAHLFCKTQAVPLGLPPTLSEAEVAQRCEEPVSSVLLQALEGHRLELEAEAARASGWGDDGGWD